MSTDPRIRIEGPDDLAVTTIWTLAMDAIQAANSGHPGTPMTLSPALALRGQAAVANARLAYRAHEDVVASPRWQALAAAGARPQRPLWASTGVKNPDYSDTLYVTELVAPGVVSGETIRPFCGEAEGVFNALTAAGIDLADVRQVLEDEGVEKLQTSWNDLLASVDSALD